MGEERPLSAGGDHPQDEQADLVTETGNEATEPDEETLLADVFGGADEYGVYGAPVEGSG